jgi:hypothetical protein
MQDASQYQINVGVLIEGNKNCLLVMTILCVFFAKTLKNSPNQPIDILQTLLLWQTPLQVFR